jgi:hypothetical protein
VPGHLSLGVKRPGREADHSPPSSAEVKEGVELYLHSQYAFMAWCSVKAQGELYVYLNFIQRRFFIYIGYIESNTSVTVNDEVRRSSKDNRVVAYFKALFQHLLEGLRTVTKISVWIADIWAENLTRDLVVTTIQSRISMGKPLAIMQFASFFAALTQGVLSFV